MALTPLRFIREHILDMTQTELAAELKVSQERISNVERNPKSVVPQSYRAKLNQLAKKAGKAIEEKWFDAVPLPRGARRKA